MKRTVYWLEPVRDEAQNLHACIKNRLSQTVKPHTLFFVNDGSRDETENILAYARFNSKTRVDFVSLPYHAKSYLSDPSTVGGFSRVLNAGLPIPKDCNYFIQASPDVMFPLDYTENLIKTMEENPKLVICGGQDQNEPNYRSHVRGCGRLYRVSFWNKFIKVFPKFFTYESFPLYKALSLGFEVRSFPSIPIYIQRKTSVRKLRLGYAMREFGYFPPFALAKCLLSILAEPRRGILITTAYLRSPFKSEDKNIRDFLRWHQTQKVLHLKEALRHWRSRF